MNSSKWITPSVKQIWCASSPIIAMTGLGILMGHTSCLLSALQAPDSPIKTDIHSVSWLASVLGPSVFTGTVLSCILMDWLGRRRSNLISILPGILGWIMIYFAQNYAVLLIGRMLAAMTSGGMYTIGIVVIGEYTSPQNRGMLLNLKTTTVTIGSLVAHISAYHMHWRTIAIVALIPHIVALLITCTWPESPTWLATRKQFDKCEKEFFWLRGINESSVKEVTEIIKAQKERPSQLKKNICTLGKITELLRKFTRKDFLKPIFTLTVSFIVMEACGRHYFPAYGLQIMDGALNIKIMPFYYTFCVDLIIVISSTLSSVFIRIIKRRTLLFSTGIASLVVLICLCIYLFLISQNVVSNNHPWIITLILIIYFFLINLACVPIPFTLQGELLPVAHRESGSAIFGALLALFFMVCMKVTPYFLSATKVYGTFAIYGMIMATSLTILYFILPETKDRTLQEIENYYNHGKFTDIQEKDEEELKIIADK